MAPIVYFGQGKYLIDMEDREGNTIKATRLFYLHKDDVSFPENVFLSQMVDPSGLYK